MILAETEKIHGFFIIKLLHSKKLKGSSPG